MQFVWCSKMYWKKELLRILMDCAHLSFGCLKSRKHRHVKYNIGTTTPRHEIQQSNDCSTDSETNIFTSNRSGMYYSKFPKKIFFTLCILFATTSLFLPTWPEYSEKGKNKKLQALVLTQNLSPAWASGDLETTVILHINSTPSFISV